VCFGRKSRNKAVELSVVFFLVFFLVFVVFGINSFWFVVFRFGLSWFLGWVDSSLPGVPDQN